MELLEKVKQIYECFKELYNMKVEMIANDADYAFELDGKWITLDNIESSDVIHQHLFYILMCDDNTDLQRKADLIYLYSTCVYNIRHLNEILVFKRELDSSAEQFLKTLMDLNLFYILDDIYDKKELKFFKKGIK